MTDILWCNWFLSWFEIRQHLPTASQRLLTKKDKISDSSHTSDSTAQAIIYVKSIDFGFATDAELTWRIAPWNGWRACKCALIASRRIAKRSSEENDLLQIPESFYTWSIVLRDLSKLGDSSPDLLGNRATNARWIQTTYTILTLSTILLSLSSKTCNSHFAFFFF